MTGLLAGYAIGICTTTVCIAINRTWIPKFIVNNASKNLFVDMFKTILRAPVHWFDVTPTGRILSRLAFDTNNCDTTVYQLLT